MECLLLKCSFQEVLPIWRDELWPKRITAIEKTNPLLFKKGWNLQHQSTEVFFMKVEKNKKIIAVCSMQKTADQEFRSRGLWVSEEFRKQGIGSKLFQALEKEALSRGCSRLWTLARHSSLIFYTKMGMKDCGKTYDFEYGPHYWMLKIMS